MGFLKVGRAVFCDGILLFCYEHFAATALLSSKKGFFWPFPIIAC